MGKQSKAIGKSLDKVIGDACKALVLEINRELRKSTPVDTGHARANWVPTVGFAGIVQGNAAPDVSAILSFKLGDGSLYVSNNVPYVSRLNNGHSTQAPALFVEASVDRALTKIKARLAGSGLDLFHSQYQSAVGAAGAENMASAYSPFGDD